jgi:phosphoglycolate phosphatase-like HAD superfamily hydrolase
MTVRAARNRRGIPVDPPVADTISTPIDNPASNRNVTGNHRRTTGADPLISAPINIDAAAIRTKSDLMKVMLTILDARAKNRRVAFVFDIDNTLMDTRHRTAGATSSFSFRGANPLASATYETVAYRPDDTCTGLGVNDPDTVAAFRDHFDNFFWSPANLTLDRPLDGPIALAKLARSLGAELYFLTGRTTAFREATLAQLEQAGIAPETAGHLIMKSPKRDKQGKLEPTERYKARELRKLYRQKMTIAGFVTEGSRDMCWLQKHVREVRRYLFLEFPIDEPGYKVKKERTIFLPVALSVPTKDEVLARFRGARV